MTKRIVLYFAHPVGGDVAANIEQAKKWLAWLMVSEPSITFIAPWLAAILSGADDDSPMQRERGLLDAVEVVGRCDGIVLCGGRISNGMQRELDACIASSGDIYDLTPLGSLYPADRHDGWFDLSKWRKRVGVWTDGTDTVVAADLLDVVRVIVNHAGSFESKIDDWRRVEDDESITLNSCDNPFADDAVNGKLTLTAAEWAAKNGRGLLCSTEY